jgi:hypothetical protein
VWGCCDEALSRPVPTHVGHFALANVKGQSFIQSRCTVTFAMDTMVFGRVRAYF